MEDAHEKTSLESREPSIEDLVDLCERLNQAGAKYVIIGGFAVRAAGYDRRTMDVDVLVDGSLENEARVIGAVAQLPDHAAAELAPGEISKYVVVRVADEIVVDLMQSASGVTYDQAAGEVDLHDIRGVKIPFASPKLLLRMKADSVREKDLADAKFLRRLLASSP